MIIANWKMHVPDQALERYFAELQEYISGMTEVYIAPPFTLLAEVARVSGLRVLAQNGHYAPSGAFTGEISIAMLKELGVHGVIVGHSERRCLFAENDELINRKVLACQENSLTAVLCVGESEQEREAGDTFAVLARQMATGLRGVGSTGVLIAYEPLWAIGTGRVATPEQVQEVHSYLKQVQGNARAVIYGGSVKPDNAAGLLELEDVDGVLVGGASLNGDTFGKICTASRKQ